MKFLLALCLIVLAALAYAAPPEQCLLPKSTGVGRAAIPRFYYNSVSGECEQFGWGGVERGSNANNFETKEKCEAECKVKTN